MAGALYDGQGGARVQGGCDDKTSYEVDGGHIDAIVDIWSSRKLYTAYIDQPKSPGIDCEAV